MFYFGKYANLGNMLETTVKKKVSFQSTNYNVPEVLPFLAMMHLCNFTVFNIEDCKCALYKNQFIQFTNCTGYKLNIIGAR